jgi:hypothetical protein
MVMVKISDSSTYNNSTVGIVLANSRIPTEVFMPARFFLIPDISTS